ncbi:4-alpha-glucanotransferase [Corynebacterium sp. H113]|uniref:4-alpha-glucanotransferase n=1 Tax=Corynebacterium sp. H113 TaxID=3133419 RepID=UPI0030B502CE
MMKKVTTLDATIPVTSPLADLAKDVGIATNYYAFDGEYVTVSRRTILKVLAALDIDLGDDPTDEEVEAARTAWADDRWSQLLPPAVVTRRGRYNTVIVHVPDGTKVSVSALLNDGTVHPFAQVEHNVAPRVVDGVSIGEAAFAIPEDLPLGWHRLRADNDGTIAECDLAVTPERLSTADKFVAKPASGIMAQLYSVRSDRSWGIGDLSTLADLVAEAAKYADADFVLINPLHAAEPCPPVENSPYLPTTRRYTNPLYIRPELIPEFGYLDEDEADVARATAAEFRELNHTTTEIERNPIYAAKLRVLRAVHRVPLSPARASDYERFLAQEGRGIYDYAQWCTQREIDLRLAARDDESFASNSFADHVEPFGAHEDIEAFRQETMDFHCWMQWIVDEQLANAQKEATDAGMRIGVMADLAVGVHPGGADAENLAEWLAPDISVGAPPDGFNQQGQDWSQPPWNPHKLAKAGYRPWRDMLRTILRRAGGIRVDHILGLFRLWVMPRMEPPTEGTYVYFDHEAMVGILALEAELADAVVIGEDLGTFEPWVQDYLAERGVMGTSILWFESDGDHPKPAEHYRSLCLSSVTTHDLPPTAGYLAGEHIKLRDRLGILLSDADEEEKRDFAWIAKVLAAAQSAGCFADTDAAYVNFEALQRDDLPDVDILIEGLHKYLARTPSALKCAALTDLVSDKRTQNQPGTVHDQYPNWCVPLTDGDGNAVLVSDLVDYPSFADVTKAMNG